MKKIWVEKVDNEELAERSEEWVMCEEQLEAIRMTLNEQLTDRQRALLRCYDKAFREIIERCAYQSFVLGFRMAAKTKK